MPSHYADRPTATLQARRAHLLTLPRLPVAEERGELWAIEAELATRPALSIGIPFISPSVKSP